MPNKLPEIPELKDDQRRRFVEYIIAGHSNAEAYRLAGYKAKTVQSRSTAAGRLLKNVEVATYKAARQKEIKRQNLASFDERMELCSNLIRDPAFQVNPLALKAIEIMNKMEGVGNPEADATAGLAAAIAGLGAMGVVSEKM
jgi:hypothetical protein